MVRRLRCFSDTKSASPSGARCPDLHCGRVNNTLSGGWLAGAGLGVLAGSAVQLQEPALSPVATYGIALAFGLVVLAGLAVLRMRGTRALGLALLAGGLAAWGATGWRAQLRLADALPPALEGRDLEITGVVASLPALRPDGVQFRFDVEAAQLDGRVVQVPARIALGWYRGWNEDALIAGPQSELRAGQRWRFTVRLRQPHGHVNPHGFDYELWLFEQGVRATGYVRKTAASQAELLHAAAGYPVERARQQVRDDLRARLGDVPAAGVLAALAVGDQASIGRDDWEVFRATGVAHLVSISGLHVTMFVWLAGAVIGALWRRSGWLMLRWPAGRAARWGGLAAGVAYAMLAGWGVPAQRTVWMVAVATLLPATGARWPWPMVWGASAVAVTLLDPWALLQPGFWLSFVAVGLLLATGAGAPVPRLHDARPPWAGIAAWRGWAWATGAWLAGRLARGLKTAVPAGLRSQFTATLGLAPLSLLFFHQLSLVGFAANLVAIPLITLAITPLALLGVAAAPLWSAGAWLVDALMAGLEALAALPWASWSAPAAPAWSQAAGLLGAALLVAPLPRRLRVLGAPMLLPLLWPAVAAMPNGQFEVLAADVGQGTAVLVRTARHALLYDAGPQYSRESDAGERVLVPLLRAEGMRRLDVLMLSHRDTDHVGGAAAVLRSPGAALLSSSLEDGHPLRSALAEGSLAVDEPPPAGPDAAGPNAGGLTAAPSPATGRGATAPSHQRCTAGQSWTWDGVRFELLHPQPADYERAAREAVKPNALSCVLLVSANGPAGRRILLAGDVERPQEARLAQQPVPRADVLLVPHHGSRTSSTPEFLDAVQPQLALVQAGYRNRFGHPSPVVLARYTERHIPVRRSDECGAWRWRSDQPPTAGRCQRWQERRYWRAAGATEAQAGANDGPEIAKLPQP
jgi:competence protein ComEC